LEHRLTERTQPDRRLRPLEFAALAVVLGLTAYLYRSTLSGFFLQDDFGWLYESRFATFREYLACFFRFSSALAYRPLSQETFFLVGQKLFGLQPLGYHVGSLVVHLAGVSVLYALLRQFAGKIPSWAACLFYALHPAHSRSIGWISAVAEPMALMFYVTAMLYFVRYDRERRVGFLLLSLGAMLLGLMSKESILTVPLVFAAYCLIFAPRRILFALPHFAIAGGYAVARALSHSVGPAPYPLTFGREAWQNLLSYMSWAVGFTESLLQQKLHWDAQRAYPWLALVLFAVVAIALLLARERRVALFALVWFCVALQPVLYFSQHIFPYYLAPALAGLSLLLATALEGLSQRNRWCSLAAAVGLVVFSFWACRAITKTEVRWWNEFSRVGQRILQRMPALEKSVPAGKQAYIFGLGEDEFGAMQNDAALKAFGHSPARFILVGLDRETSSQIRALKRNSGLSDYYCFVYSNGDFADWTEYFRRDPEPILLIRPADYLENLYRSRYSTSAVRLTANKTSVIAGRDTLELRLIGLDVPAIDVLYTFERRLMPPVLSWKVESDRTLRVRVDASTPRGWYHYRAIRDSRSKDPDGWMPVNVGILVQ
jgi:hypothetical protein